MNLIGFIIRICHDARSSESIKCRVKVWATSLRNFALLMDQKDN